MNNKLTDEAIRRVLEETLDKDELTQHDYDTILKACTIQANLDKNETERYSADRRRESEMYAASKRARADKDTARIKAEADERCYRKQFWGNVLSTGGQIASTILSTGAVMLMFERGLTFEQTGVFTSQMTRGLVGKLFGLIKR